MRGRMLKKYFHVVWVFGFILMVIGNSSFAAEKGTDIVKMASVIEENGGTIVGWSLYTRERVDFSNEKEWAETKRELEAQFPDMAWTSSFHGGTRTVTGFVHNGTFTEKINLRSTDKNGQITAYLLYEAAGSKWDARTAGLAARQMEDRSALLYAGPPVIFSCIKGEFKEEWNGFIDDSLQGLLQALQVKDERSFTERGFYSLSAYSSLFEQPLALPDQTMNMQLGLRKNTLGPGTDFVLGTPILTIEY